MSYTRLLQTKRSACSKRRDRVRDRGQCPCPTCCPLFRGPFSPQQEESLLLDVFLVPRPLHGFGPPSLLFLAHIVLKRRRNDQQIHTTESNSGGKPLPGEAQPRRAADSYHEVRVGLPVIGAPVVLGDGHGVACRSLPHLKEQCAGSRRPGRSPRPTGRLPAPSTPTPTWLGAVPPRQRGVSTSPARGPQHHKAKKHSPAFLALF